MLWFAEMPAGMYCMCVVSMLIQVALWMVQAACSLAAQTQEAMSWLGKLSSVVRTCNDWHAVHSLNDGGRWMQTHTKLQELAQL